MIMIGNLFRKSSISLKNILTPYVDAVEGGFSIFCKICAGGGGSVIVTLELVIARIIPFTNRSSAAASRMAAF